MADPSKCPICGEQVPLADAPAHRAQHRVDTDRLTQITEDIRAIRNIAAIAVIVIVIGFILVLRGLP